MPGPNRAPRGGYVKPKNMGRTIRRLVGYLTRSKLPLLMVLLFLVSGMCARYYLEGHTDREFLAGRT